MLTNGRAEKAAWRDELGTLHLVSFWKTPYWHTQCEAVVNSVDPRNSHSFAPLSEITCHRCLVEYAAMRLRGAP